jgi:hypothetical protein
MNLRQAFFIIGTAGLIAVINAQTWIDISTSKVNTLGTQPWPGGCAGISVNRLNGDVLVNIVGFGIWKSIDKGQTWTDWSKGVVSGRGESGQAVQIDQDNPTRMAVFSLDGDAGYTTDGTAWKKMAGMGRNWDFGSVDWATADAKVMLAALHESGGLIYKTTDGAATWIKLSITAEPQWGTLTSMVGVISANTFIYSNGGGIFRSTDAGATWTSVSTINPTTHVVAQFKGAFYLGTATGLIVSKDNGATWQTLGGSISINQGPFFGADENTIAVINLQGAYKTTNAGSSWTKISGLPPLYSGNTFDPKWYGCYTWDPVYNTVYGSSMGNPAFKYQLASSTSVTGSHSSEFPALRISIFNNTINSGTLFTKVELFSLSGELIYQRNVSPAFSATIPQIQSPLIVRITWLDGATFYHTIIQENE